MPSDKPTATAGAVPPSGGAESPPEVTAASFTGGTGSPGVTSIDIGQLASILMQAKGPIIDRLGRALPKFSGDGTLDVAEWLDDLERRCKVERVGPEEVVDFLLEGNAARMFRALRVSEASQWEVVKGALLAQYGLSRQEAYRRFTDRQLQAGEAVDVYMDDLQRLGARVGAKPEDMFFRVKFLEGLPSSTHKWAVMLPEVYTSDFDKLLSKVRDRLSAQRAATGHANNSKTNVVAAASKKPGLVCPRCTGPHRVRDCTQSRRKAKAVPSSSSKKDSLCFRCKKPGHFARDCQEPAAAAAGSGFHEEGVARGTTPSNVETMEE